MWKWKNREKGECATKIVTKCDSKQEVILERYFSEYRL